jgi:hypothetical protein
MPSRRVDCKPMSEGKVVIFSCLESTYWGKRINFLFDIGSKKGFLTGITELSHIRAHRELYQNSLFKQQDNIITRLIVAALMIIPTTLWITAM